MAKRLGPRLRVPEFDDSLKYLKQKEHRSEFDDSFKYLKQLLAVLERVDQKRRERDHRKIQSWILVSDPSSTSQFITLPQASHDLEICMVIIASGQDALEIIKQDMDHACLFDMVCLKIQPGNNTSLVTAISIRELGFSRPVVAYTDSPSGFDMKPWRFAGMSIITGFGLVSYYNKSTLKLLGALFPGHGQLSKRWEPAKKQSKNSPHAAAYNDGQTLVSPFVSEFRKTIRFAHCYPISSSKARQCMHTSHDVSVQIIACDFGIVDLWSWLQSYHSDVFGFGQLHYEILLLKIFGANWLNRGYNGEKPYKCTFASCDKRFVQKGNLQTHERRHLVELPFKCHFMGCTRAFSRKANLAAHLETHYKKKTFCCIMKSCGKSFTSRSNLKTHQSNYHKEELKLANMSPVAAITEVDQEPLDYVLRIHKNCPVSSTVDRGTHLYDDAPHKPTVVSNTSDGSLSMMKQDQANSEILQELGLGQSISCHEPKSSKHCHSEAESESDSTDGSGSAWMSDYSEDITQLSSANPLFNGKKEFLQSTMEAFLATEKQMASLQKHSPKGCTPQSVGSSSTRGRQSNSSKKRVRSRESSSRNRSQDRQKQKACKKRKVSGRQLSLACPFAKKDPIRYRQCYRYILTRVRDVKQHLSRCHHMPLYCPRCMDVFTDENYRDLHVRALNCTERPLVRMEGISAEQKAELSRRVSSRLPEAEQWFTVFEILFPGSPRPPSPYIDLGLSEEMFRFRDYLTYQGPYLLSEFLQTKDLCRQNEPPSEQDLTAFSASTLTEGLQLIFDRWIVANTTNPPPESRASLAAMQGDSISLEMSDEFQDSGLDDAPSTTTVGSSSGQDEPLLATDIDATEESEKGQTNFTSPILSMDEGLDINAINHDDSIPQLSQQPSFNYDFQFDDLYELPDPHIPMGIDDTYMNAEMAGLPEAADSLPLLLSNGLDIDVVEEMKAR